jgi:hypothetical protein
VKLLIPISFATVISAVLLGTWSANAQAYSENVSSLAQIGCSKVEGIGGFEAIYEDVPIGRSIVTAVARMGGLGPTAESPFGNAGRITTDKPLEVVCRLAGNGETPIFRTLTLAFGFRSDGRSSDSSNRVRLSVYRDGNLYDSKTIIRGDRLIWPIDVTNTRSVTLRADCFGARESWCPNIYFFQDTLER